MKIKYQEIEWSGYMEPKMTAEEMAAFKDKMDREAKERNDSANKLNKLAENFRELSGWLPMSTCPFSDLDNAYGNCYILVRDEDSWAVVSVSDRCGEPCVENKSELPKWWFEWELTDELSSEDERFGKDEIDFCPDYFMPLPVKAW